MALLTLLTVSLVTFAVAQEDADAPADDATVAEESVEQAQADIEAAEAEETADDAPIDDEFYQDVDDEDFRPSEDIPADQSIPFPTDI